MSSRAQKYELSCKQKGRLKAAFSIREPRFAVCHDVLNLLSQVGTYSLDQPCLAAIASPN